MGRCLGTACVACADDGVCVWARARRRREERREWLADFATLAPIFRDYVRPADRILMLGCGNSSLGPDMVRADSYAARAGGRPPPAARCRYIAADAWWRAARRWLHSHREHGHFFDCHRQNEDRTRRECSANLRSFVCLVVFCGCCFFVVRPAAFWPQAAAGMEWLVMDMRELAFEAGRQFDVILDKAAMDAMLVRGCE